MKFKVLLFYLLGVLSITLCEDGVEFGGVKFDSFGGNKSVKGKSTGFFHIENVDGRYYFITPKGNGYRALGINHFHNMTSKNFDKVIQNIKSWGFNAGCYQGPRWMWNRIPYTKGINLVSVSQWKSGSQFRFKDVFDPNFLAEMEQSIRKITKPQSENKMLIGYFLTDIPLWERRRSGEDWISFYKSLPANSEGAKVWQQWKENNPSAKENAFLAVIARQLYSKGHQFIRKYDKNHLILGDRYHEKVDMPEIVVREALPYIDAISIQPTVRDFDSESFHELYKLYNKPIYIADHVSSFATTKHPKTMGQKANNPESYVVYYRRYVTEALSHPYVIGYNKCQYQDEFVRAGILKQGILQRNEEPYPIVDGITDANKKALKKVFKHLQTRF